MFCSRCGKENPNEASTCNGCGAPLSSQAVQANLATGALPGGYSQYAGFWRRFAASFIDGLVLSIPLGAISFPFQMFPSPSHIGKLMGFLACWLYFALMESSSKQATLGKMAIGIVVTDLEGRRITFGRASGRYFGKLLSELTLGIGFLMIGFTRKKQGLHDMVAGTLVNVKPGKEKQNATIVVIAAIVCVLSVVAILAAILIPNFIRAKSFSQLAACESNMKNIATGIDTYASNNGGNYPDTSDQSVSVDSVPGLSPTYVQSLPHDVATGKPYLYSGGKLPEPHYSVCAPDPAAYMNHTELCYSSSEGLVVK